MFNKKQVISAIGAFVLAAAAANAEDFGAFNLGQGALDAIGSIKKQSGTLQKKKKGEFKQRAERARKAKRKTRPGGGGGFDGCAPLEKRMQGTAEPTAPREEPTDSPSKTSPRRPADGTEDGEPMQDAISGGGSGGGGPCAIRSGGQASPGKPSKSKPSRPPSNGD